MAANILPFVRKWNGRTLEDAGCYVSKDYKSFQTAFINAMKKIAEDLGGEVVGANKGHYDISGFIQVGEKFIYFNYDTSLCPGGRTHIWLKDTSSCWMQPLLIRTAKHAKDYTGGCNNYASFVDCQQLIERLLNS